MTDASSESKDILLALHRENSAQARYHERQRLTIVIMVALTTALLLGFMVPQEGNFRLYGNYGMLLHAFFLIMTGACGFVASLRHHERSRLHVQRVHVVRRELSRLFAVDIPQLYAAANAEHIKRFARLSERTARMHYVWQAFHVAVIAVGVTLVGLIACCPNR